MAFYREYNSSEPCPRAPWERTSHNFKVTIPEEEAICTQCGGVVFCEGGSRAHYWRVEPKGALSRPKLVLVDGVWSIVGGEDEKGA